MCPATSASSSLARRLGDLALLLARHGGLDLDQLVVVQRLVRLAERGLRQSLLADLDHGLERMGQAAQYFR